MVRPVDIDMAGQACAPDHPPVGQAARQPERCGGMPRFVVALLTEPRRPYAQEPWIVAAVSDVTGDAIFTDRRVFIEKRSPPIRMASIAVLVHAVILNEGFRE